MPNPSATKGSAVRFNVAITVIFTLLCVAGVVFMIRFLIALSMDGRAKSRCRVVYWTSGHTETEGDASRLAVRAGTALKSGANSRPGFEVIAGRGGRPFRRVG